MKFDDIFKEIDKNYKGSMTPKESVEMMNKRMIDDVKEISEEQHIELAKKVIELIKDNRDQ